MLVDEHNSNVLALLRKFVECLLYRRLLGLVVDHQEVSLRVRWLRDMANASEEDSRDGADDCQGLV